MNKKVNMFGKTVPVFVLVLLGMGVVAAALIPYFGMITGTVTVSQGLLVDALEMDASGAITDGPFNMYSLESRVFASAHRLSNGADVDAEIELVKDYPMKDDTNGITAKYYKTNLRQGTLILDNKILPSWALTPGDDIGATLNYAFVDNTFSYDLTAKVLQTSTQYVLIYYADQPDRFGNWGGAPALELGRATSDGNGDLVISAGSKVIPGGLLPYASDWNAGEDANYCGTLDNYDYCKGAKIWLIPASDYNGDEVMLNWNPTAYLYETELLGWNHLESEEEITGPFTVSASNNVDFVIVSSFPQMTYPGTYTVTTTVNPAP